MSSEHRYSLPPQTRLRQYVLGRLLGHGGFGLTYLARDLKLGREVAIKELLPQDFVMRAKDGNSIVVRSNDQLDNFNWSKKRFLEEARTLASLHHNAILPVHEIFEENGTAYMVTDFIKGNTLEDWLRKKGTPSEAVLRGFLLELLDALDIVHERGILHRDLTPGNIIIDQESRPVLIDFGNARVATGEKTASVTAVLTPGYAPFEQYSSTAKQGSPTDIYALGAVLYRAITGQKPDDSVTRKADDRLPKLAGGKYTSFSREFLDSIDRALQMRYENRWQACRQWRAALRTHGPVPQPKPGQGKLIAVAIVLLLAAIAGGLYYGFRGGEVAPPVVEAEKPSGGAPQNAEIPKAEMNGDTMPKPGRQIEPPVAPRDPWTASLEKPFVNSISMSFVPVKITGGGPSDGKIVLFSQYETRVRDLAGFPGKQNLTSSSRNPDEPVCGVNLQQAEDFCAWLSKNEGLKYRIPTDHEWSCAVALDEDESEDPMGLKKRKGPDFPWGRSFETGTAMGNYAPDVFRDIYPAAAPAGCFPANSYGLFDMGGNAREWTTTAWRVHPNKRFVRGGSWKTSRGVGQDMEFDYLYSFRREVQEADGLEPDIGFRCVISKE